MTPIHACSTNAGKLREFALAANGLKGRSYEIAPLPDLDSIAPPEETGATFEENAILKALYYSNFTTGLILADDSGIEVDALHGAPGVHSARYAGLNATNQANNELLLLNMKGETNRSARFVCVLAVAKQGELKHVVRGQVEGELLHQPVGNEGFGYDPLFYYAPFGASFGEVADSRKFAVSHRGNALRILFAQLNDQPTPGFR